MGKRKKAYPKGDVVFHMSAEEATCAKMPKYNAYAGGYGAHGSKKYDRRKAEREWKREAGLD